VVGGAQGLSPRWRAVRKATTLLGMFVLAVSAAAGAQTYVAAGGCRDGVRNGAYELRMPDGQLRVAGAFAKGRRTGTFLFWASTGARIAVIPYEDDVKIGTVAVWYAPSAPGGEPRRKLESAYAGGLLHGTTRSWHENGRRRTEYRYERGELAVADAWTASGTRLPAAEARRLAERDRAADANFYASLEQIVADNAPHCD
jgi:antitoxin component YwqK of YwqJK toxin-antitoxin module